MTLVLLLTHRLHIKSKKEMKKLKLRDCFYWTSFVLGMLKVINFLHISWLIVVSPVISYYVLYILFMIVGALAFRDTY